MSYRSGAKALGLATLVAVGGMASAPEIAASEIEKGDLKIKFGLRMQSRIESALDVKDQNGNKRGLLGQQNANDDYQDVDLYFRRVRFGMGGSYKDTSFYLNFNMDRYGRHNAANNNTNPPTPAYRTNTPGPAVHDAWIRHTVKSDDLTHAITFGRQQQWFNMASVDSSGRSLFPNGRPAMGHKNIGLAYKLTAPVFSAGLDIQNSGGDSREWVISARVETSLTEDMKMRRTESALGKEGFGHVAGVDIAHLTNSVDGNNGWTQFGIDYNIHYNNITGVLDFALRQNNIDGASNTTHMMITAQAGYAIPLQSGLVVEPALRFIYRDQDIDGPIALATDEGVNQGFQVDAGVNVYVNGHNNKFQFAVSHWSADEGDAKKTVLRLQHQFQF